MGNLESFEIAWDKVEVNNFTPLTPGIYAAKVIKSGITKTKVGDNMLTLTFEVLGANKGRRIFENYMLTHSNPKAVQAGLGRVKSLAANIEVDFDKLQDTSELHGKPVGIKVKIEESEEYGDRNRISGFLAYEESMLAGAEGPVAEVEVDAVEKLSDIEEDTYLSPSFIRGLKKQEFLTFVKDKGIDLVLTGKKLSQLKDEVVDKLFGASIEDGDDIVIDE